MPPETYSSQFSDSAKVPFSELRGDDLGRLRKYMETIYSKTSYDTVFGPRKVESGSPEALYAEVVDRKFRDMRQELSRMDTVLAMFMERLEARYEQRSNSLEAVISALVAQNRELSRRVTELEWEGITP